MVENQNPAGSQKFNSPASVGQIIREVPGLTADVIGTDGKLQRESNFYELINELPFVESADKKTKKEMSEVVGGVVNELEKLPPQLIKDLKEGKRYAWIALGLGALTITIATGMEIKRGGRDLRILMDYLHVLKGKVEKIKQEL